MWSLEESVQLIRHSAEGMSRSDLERKFSRSTGHIFSKIQKHLKLTQQLVDSLLKGNFVNGTSNHASFEAMIKYIQIYSRLVPFTTSSNCVARIVPYFIVEEPDPDDLIKRVTQAGLSQGEAN